MQSKAKRFWSRRITLSWYGSVVARISGRFWCRVSSPVWGIGLLLLLPVPGSGAEDDQIPRKIVGGQATNTQTYPFVVQVVGPTLNTCTGSIVAPTWILTAAHCVWTKNGPWWTQGPADPHQVSIRHDTDSDWKYAKRVIPNIRYFGGPRTPADIALIEISQPYPTSLVVPLASRSAEQKYAPSGSSATLIGYGFMENGRWPSGMRSVDVTLYHSADCRERFDLLDEAYAVRDDAICGGSSTKRAAPGDSGGPMIVAYPEGEGTKWLQVGEGSMLGLGVYPRSRVPLTSIYMRVSSYTAWIQQITGGVVSPVVYSASTDPADPYPDDPEQLKVRLSKTQKQTESLQSTAQSLRNVRSQLQFSINQFRRVEGQDKSLQTTEDGILSSVSTLLAE